MSLAILIICGLAAATILAGVVFVVMGRGGQMTRFEADYAPLDLPSDRALVSADVGSLRLPLSLWGYHVRAVDEVLSHVAATLRERDRRIGALEDRVAELGGVPSAPTARPAQSVGEARANSNGNAARAERPRPPGPVAPPSAPAATSEPVPEGDS